MSLTTDLKNQAKQIYKTNFGRNAGIGFVAFTIKAAVFLIIATLQFLCVQTFGSSFMYGAPSLVFWLLYALAYIFAVLPINTGLGTYFTKISLGEKCVTDNIFAHYRSFKNDIPPHIIVSLIIFGEILLWQVLSFILFKIFTGFTQVLAIGIILFLLLAVLVLYTVLTYAPVSYIIEKNGSRDAFLTCKRAAMLTKGNRRRLLGIVCSFLPYILLSVLTLGIGFIWLNPYINITTKLFYDKIERGF